MGFIRAGEKQSSSPREICQKPSNSQRTRLEDLVLGHQPMFEGMPRYETFFGNICLREVVVIKPMLSGKGSE